jgi:hypothetical protein
MGQSTLTNGVGALEPAGVAVPRSMRAPESPVDLDDAVGRGLVGLEPLAGGATFDPLARLVAVGRRCPADAGPDVDEPERIAGSLVTVGLTVNQNGV